MTARNGHGAETVVAPLRTRTIRVVRPDLLGLVYPASLVFLCFPSLANVTVATLAILTATIASQRTPRTLPSELGWALGLFVCSIAVSTLESEEVEHSLVFLTAMVPGVLLFFGVGLLSDEKDLVPLFRAAALAVCGLGLAVIASVLAYGAGEPLEQLDTAFLVAPNDVCFLAVMLPAALALPRCTGRRIDRALACIAVFATVTASVLLLSRLGVLCAAASVVGYLAVVSGRRWAAGGAAVAIATLVGVVDAALGAGWLHKVLSVSWLTRVPTWGVAVEMFRDAPFIGNGPRTYGVLFDDYYGNVQRAIGDWMEMRHTPWAHNLYLETLAEQGVVGLVALLAVLAAATRILFKDRTSRRGDPVRASAQVAFLVLLLTYAFEASFVRLWVVVGTAFWLGVTTMVGAAPVEDGTRSPVSARAQ